MLFVGAKSITSDSSSPETITVFEIEVEALTRVSQS